ncbi:hypothetical protein [Merismopedia glauca]|uniref:Low temperature-induced protein n=1 Tax=Merismopedia glauca CCAP 1448/3 TaxID=1296344 RepID=A0A2T1C3G9_9CYAN|nr:hypothetical protein [Merismopedia glauca]PSB02663.1 hypothetical protein C7B64_12180 [Merismopedia glauca CCAP 1448/3]
MNFSQFKKQFRPVRFLVMAIACLFVLFSNVPQASANMAGQSSPQKGAEQLNSIEQESENLTFREPDDLKDVQSRANKGINEVQGDADADKMKNPGNSGGVNTVEKQVKNLLEKATGK